MNVEKEQPVLGDVEGFPFEEDLVCAQGHVLSFHRVALQQVVLLAVDRR